MAAKPLPEKSIRLNAPQRRAPSDPYAGVDAAVADAVKSAVAAHAARKGPLLPVLHAVQDRLGFLPHDVVPLVAHELNITRAEIHGVITFYHHFRTTPPAHVRVQLCRAEACQALGSRALENHVKQSLGIGFGETSADGAFSLEPVYCLGNCGCGPSLLIGDDELHARVTPEKFDALIERAKLAAS